MSPTPVDIDRAVETLREESPRPEAVAATRIALARPVQGKLLRGRWFVAAATVAAIAGLLWPRAGSGATWAESVARTLQAGNMAITSYREDGRVMAKMWRSGQKRATLLYTQNGDLLCEMRRDGRRAVNYFNFRLIGNQPNRAPNAQKFAITCDDAFDVTSKFELPLYSIDALLKSPGLNVLEHRRPEGGPERYRISLGRPRSGELIVMLDKDRRITELRDPKSLSREVLDYPDSLPENTFEPKIQVARNVATYDLNDELSQAKRSIKNGLGEQGPVTLRLVTLDGEGELWAFWTGATLDRRLLAPIRIPGVRVSGLNSFKELTNATAGKPLPSIGKRLDGMGCTPMSKLGQSVNLDVPYDGGVAHFRDVPILRIGMLRHIQEAIGLKNL
jgi:hypothetical protein